MKRIAVVFGGDSLEHDISIITAFFVMEECKKSNIDFMPLYLSRKGVFYTGKALFNKDNYDKLNGFKRGYFKFKQGCNVFVARHKSYIIDCALLCVHGANVEDGTLGAFFDILKIPNSYSGVLNASLIQDKNMTKILLKNLKIPVVNHILIRNVEELILHTYEFPLIVKPCHLGSSIGVAKVHDFTELKAAVEESLTYDDCALIEDLVTNLREVNIAALGEKETVVLSAIEEVNQRNDVLSFADKYQQFQGKLDSHIIPAQLDKKTQDLIEKYTRKAFRELGCMGVMRFDYLINNETKEIFLNEINAIPGSLAFYLFEKNNISFRQIIESLVMISKKKYYIKRKMLTSYKLSDLKKLGRKK